MDIITKTAKFKEFPGLEIIFQNSRGFKEIKDPLRTLLHVTHNIVRLDIRIMVQSYAALQNAQLNCLASVLPVLSL